MNKRTLKTWDAVLDEELQDLDPNERAEREIFVHRLIARLRPVKLSVVRELVSALDGNPVGFERDRETVIRQLVRVWLTARKGWVRPKVKLEAHFTTPKARRSPRYAER